MSNCSRSRLACGSVVSSSFPTFRFPSMQRKQCGKQDMENKRVDALTRSHQFRYCIFPFFPPRFTFNAALHRAFIFWAGFYYGWHKRRKCVSFNYATLRDTGVHVACSRLLCVPISCGIACLSNILSFSGYHSCCFTSSVISVAFNYATSKDKAMHVADNLLLYVYISFTLACFPNIPPFSLQMYIALR